MTDHTPAPSPTTTPARLCWAYGCYAPAVEDGWCARHFRTLEAPQQGVVPPSAPPAPAPGELDLDEMERLAREATQGPWSFDGISLAAWDGKRLDAEWMPNGDYGNEKADGAFFAFCTPQRVAQLVAAARLASAIQPGDRELLRRVADYCDGVANRDTDTGQQLRAFADRLAARASRPPSGADDAR